MDVSTEAAIIIELDEVALLPTNSPNFVSVNATEEQNFLFQFKEFYSIFHGYLSLTVCFFGLFANLLNIIVLTRKEMISPTNAILTGLALADVLVMIDYMPFAVHNYIRNGLTDEEMYPYGWAVFTLFHAHFSVVCHTISTWLTVLLAVWRYLSVSYPTESKVWCTMQRAVCAILATYITVPICCIPVYLTFTIVRDSQNEKIYKVNWSEIALQNNGLLKNVNFWVFSVGTKLVPCMLLTYLSLALIRVLVEAEKRKQRLHQSNFPSNLRSAQITTNHKSSQDCNHHSRPSASTPCPPSASASQQSSDRTTKMLLAVLLLFLITELPSGILVLLSGIIGEKFFRDIYNPLGELMDILALINSAINFILYCSMSRLFRQTFSKLFCPTDQSVTRMRRESNSVLLKSTQQRLRKNTATTTTTLATTATTTTTLQSDQTRATFV